MFAALLLLFPVHRLVAVHWPRPIVEQMLPDGTLMLLDADASFRGDGVVRSRPLQAARVRYADGRQHLAYVVALRGPDGVAEAPPTGSEWSPPGDCELSMQRPGQAPAWIACSQVAEVIRPNRMNLLARARVAIRHVLPHGRH